MVVKVFILLLALPVAIIAIFTGTAPAESPWTNLLTVNRVEADPNKPYKLTENQGPWIIIACSFNGPDAQKKSHELALELRQRFRLEAYVHNMAFKLDDPNGDAQRLVLSSFGHQYQMVKENRQEYADGTIKEYAVVVGNFTAVDDAEAQSVLKKIKSAEPDCLRPNGEKNQSSKPFIDWESLRSLAMSQHMDNVEGRKLNGPMARAFITRNPLLPEEYFVPKTGLDELVVRMNKDVKHSLLNCPGKYTMQVAHFTGEVILDQAEIRAIENGTHPGPESTKQGLAKAAEKAHELTEALRLKGWEAYEFHDRNSSIVTIGSFESVDAKQVDGQVTYSNSQIQRIVEVCGVHKIEEGGRPPQFRIQSLVGIFFDAMPIPMEVPRRSISRQLGQRLEMAGQ